MKCFALKVIQILTFRSIIQHFHDICNDAIWFPQRLQNHYHTYTRVWTHLSFNFWNNERHKTNLKVVFLLLFSENRTMWHFNYKAQTIEDTLIVLTIDSDGNKQIFTRFFYRKIVHNADQWSLLLAGCYIHSEQNLLIYILCLLHYGN